jgi:hypothetical protein
MNLERPMASAAPSGQFYEGPGLVRGKFRSVCGGGASKGVWAVAHVSGAVPIKALMGKIDDDPFG